MYHYVYRITNKETKRHYYGVRSSKSLPKDDLGIKYFSSSTDKDFITLQKQNSILFKYKVVKIFKTRLKANEYEVLLHSKFNVGVNDLFYNLASQSSEFFIPNKNSTKKSISTRFKTIESNGLSIMINNARKAVMTRKTTLINDKTVQELLIEKTLLTKSNTLNNDGFNIHQLSAQKAKITMEKNNLYKLNSIKAVETKKSTINEDGLNIFQVSSRKAVITKKNTVDSNGKTLQQLQTEKTIKTKKELGLFKDIIVKCNETKKNRVDENGISDFDKQYKKMLDTKFKLADKYTVFDNNNNILESGLTQQMIIKKYSRSLMNTSTDNRLGKSPSAKALMIKHNKNHMIGYYIRKENNVSNN